MPKVSIREIDTTGGEQLEFLNYTVVIPGPVLADSKGNKLAAGLITKAELNTFSAKVGKVDTAGEVDGFLSDTDASNFLKQDLGFIMIKELLNRGLTIYYVPAYGWKVDANPNYSFADNLERLTIFEQAEWPDNEGEVSSNPFKILKIHDRGFCDVRFITLGGLNQIEDKVTFEIQKCALECAGDRGDAVALLDVPTIAEDDERKLDNADIIDEWINGGLPAVQADDLPACGDFSGIASTKIIREGISWTDRESESYGRYGTIFSPHFVSDFNKENAFPTSFDYLACFARYINKFKDWFAMSGSVRGVSPFANLTPTIQFGDSDVNILQKRTDTQEGHIATNVICNIRPYGNVIWGNRTMHPLSKPNNGDPNAAIQLTASSFLNIRHLCIDIKKTLYRAARRFAFEPNSDELWFSFKGAITPLLDEMKANQGIRGYQVLKVKTNKKALFVARIKIIPVEAVEDFDLTVELADSIEVTEE